MRIIKQSRGSSSEGIWIINLKSDFAFECGSPTAFMLLLSEHCRSFYRSCLDVPNFTLTKVL